MITDHDELCEVGKLAAVALGAFRGSTAGCCEGKGDSDDSLHQHSCSVILTDTSV